ncbi:MULTISPECIES: hypothetical protein [unclassified Halomonas]|uniref:hypothetical protein n=1 Tax=unclassified Halomonas TaxID=2609666 RepID=UPI001EF4F6E9|nr:MULTISPECIES: hypothetical protein [unclassified Halomonas]MCG7590013.1 hypothetical protein [Halomonas sp. McD50-5]MCG7615937.1 hypothetical protein [Halomonas sp. McD50-4]
MRYAYISKSSANESHEKWLRIDDKGIGFLLAPILRSASFTESHDGKIWHLGFFQNKFSRSLFKIELKVEFSDAPKAADEESNYLAKAMWLPREQAFSREDMRRQSSEFLRHSNTLELSSFVETTRERDFVTDRKGLVYVSNDEHQFHRVLLCLALTVAYGRVIQRCIEKLVDSINSGNSSELSKLYKEVLSYNATDYFGQPVELDRHELLSVWKNLKTHWHIDELNNELVQQLSGIAKLIEEERKKEETQQRHQFYADQNKAWQKEQQLWHQENQRLKQLHAEEKKRFEQEILNHQRITTAYREQKEAQAASQQSVEKQYKKLNIILVAITVIFTAITTLSTTPSDIGTSIQEWFSVLTRLYSWGSTHAVELWSWLISHLG